MTDINFDALSDEEIRNTPLSAFTGDSAKVEDTPVDAPETDSSVATPSSSSSSSLPESTPVADETANAVESTPDLFNDADFRESVGSLFTTGIQAGGKTVRIANPDELKRIVQQGIGVTKRMQELKPKLQMIAALEAQGITSSDINYLIDLHKRTPQAVSKLVQDSKYDVYSAPDASTYTPSDYSISDAQYALQEVLDACQHRSGYSATLEAVQRLDADSRAVLGQRPQEFAELVGDMETVVDGSSVFNDIMGIVETEKLKGNFAGVSKLDAYAQVADTLKEKIAAATRNNGASHNMGALATYFASRSTRTTPPSTVPAKYMESSSPAATSGADKNNSRTFAAAARAAHVSSPAKTVANPKQSHLSMSDDDLRKASIFLFD